MEFDEEMNVVFIEEKLEYFCFNYVVIGFYFYDNDVVEILKNIKLSFCGELEIIDVNKVYLECGDLLVELMGCGFVWLDIGIYESLLEVL